MLLYELAMELGERSADLSEKATTLGLGTLLPPDEVTAEQAATLRAAYLGPAAGGGVGPATWGAPAAPHDPSAPQRSPRGSGASWGPRVAVAAAVVVFLGGFAFLATNTGPDEARQQAIADDLAAWDAAPLATPEDGAAATDEPVDEAPQDVPSDEPADETQLCAAQDVMYDAEIRMMPGEKDINEADLAIWRTAVDDMIRWGPADLADEITGYRDASLAYYDAASRMSMGKARPYFDEVKRAEDQMYPQIIPFCGYPDE